MTIPEPEYLTYHSSAKSKTYKIRNFAGQRFGKLLVKPLFERSGRHILWTCVCDCERTRNVKSHELTSGKVTACNTCMGGKGWNRLNIAGRKFGRLTAISRFGSTPAGKATWLCSCSCVPGKTCVVVSSALTGGKQVSCGCYMIECTIARSTKHGQAKRSGHTSTWSIWTDVIKRCTNPNFWAWEHYGGRGIKVHPSWMSFSQFFADMGSRPPGLTLDRLNNDLGYEPGNCAWVSRRRQAENRRIPKNNKTGCKGVYEHVNRYHAGITAGGVKRHLGTFPLTEDGFQRAKAVRLLAEDVYWGA